MWKPRSKGTPSPFGGPRTMTVRAARLDGGVLRGAAGAHAGAGVQAMRSGGRTVGSGRSGLAGGDRPPGAQASAPVRSSRARWSPRASWTATPTSPCGRWAGGGCSWPARGPGRRRWRESRPARRRRGGWSGHGWDANGWTEPPDRHALDPVHASPVYLDSLDVHAAWVNSAALAVARITRETPDPPGGRIVRDAAGEPTGLLLERAVELVAQRRARRRRRRFSTMRCARRRRRRIAWASPASTTSRTSAPGGPSAAWRRRGVSGCACSSIPRSASLPDLIRRGARSGAGPRWLGMGGVKLFLDGSLGSRTAWMLEPYEGSRDRGMPVAGEREAAEAMRAAATQRHRGHGPRHRRRRGATGARPARGAAARGAAAPDRALPVRSPCRPGTGGSRRHRRVHAAGAPPHRHSAGGPALGQPGPRRLRLPLAAAARDRPGLRQRRAGGLDRSRARACTPRWSGRGSTARPRGGWRPEEKLGFEDVVRGYTHGAPPARRAPRADSAHWRAVLEADLVAWAVDPAVERGDGDAFRAGRAVLTVVGGRVVMHR